MRYAANMATGAVTNPSNIDPGMRLAKAAERGEVQACLDLIQQHRHSRSSLSDAMGIAAAEGHRALVEALLAAGAEVDHDDDWALYWSAINGHHDIVALLLDRRNPQWLLPHRVIMGAAGAGRRAIVEMLLDAGATVPRSEIRSRLEDVVTNAWTDGKTLTTLLAAHRGRKTAAATFLRDCIRASTHPSLQSAREQLALDEFVSAQPVESMQMP